MSHRSTAQLKVQIARALAVLALPMACAVGVEPEDTDGDSPVDMGGSGGLPSGGSPGVSGGGVVSQAGMTSSAGKTGAFGGTGGSGGAAGSTSTAGKSSGGAGGSGGGGGNGGAGGGTGGSAGSGGAGTSGAGGTGGSGTGSCDCKQKTLPWADMTNMSFVTGDCLTADGKTFLYTGAMAQTWAHPDCHPGKQMAWCAGSGYVFMACN